MESSCGAWSRRDLSRSSTSDVAVLLLTHVNYRDGRMHDMAAVNRAAHAAGVLVVWDLSHSAGAVPVDLNGDGNETRPPILPWAAATNT